MTDQYLQNLSSNMLTQLAGQKLDKTSSGMASQGRILEAAEDFEAIFLTQMLQHMYADIKTDGIFGGGHAEETWRSLLLDEYGKVMAQAGGVGITENIQRELLKLQEVGNE